MFGQPAATPFGSPPAAATPFGAPAPAPGVFGAPPAFGSPAPAPAAGGFGGFGSPPAAAPAGGGFGGFGAAPAPAPAAGGFGAFGSPPAAAPTSAFGAPAPAPSTPFGAPAPAPAGGLFGAAPAPAPPGGLFGGGATTGAFGAPAPAAGGFGTGGFGAPATGGFGAPAAAAPSAFGAPAPAPATGLFGAPAPAAFGSPAPSAGAFGAPAPAPGLFGATPAPAAGGGMFGAPSAGVVGQPGTKAVPYQVTTRTDGATSINLQTLTAMPAYESKSTEELRLEDYMAGNKGTMGQAPVASPGAFGAPAPGAFGAPAPAAFGAPAPAPGGLFGSAPAPAPAAGFGGFGAAPAPAPTTGFGGFGAPAPAPAAGGFGGFGSTAAPQPAGGGLFGSAPAPAPVGGLFGSAPAPAPAGGLFGAAPSPAPVGGGLFGSTPAAAPAGGGLFGSTPAPATSGGLFGTAPAPAPSGGLFGSTPAPAPAPAGGGLFGAAPAPAPAGSLFGAAPAPAPGGLFGSTAPAPAAGGLFGATPAAAPVGGLFGSPAPAPAPTTGLFGAAPAPTGGSLFGAPPTMAPAAAPVAAVAPPPTADALLAQQLAAVDNQKKELALLETWRGQAPSGSTVIPTSFSEKDATAGYGGGDTADRSATYAASSGLFLTYQAAPRSGAKIRPRGFTRVKSPPVVGSIGNGSVGASPLVSPNSYLGSSAKRLVINPNSLTPKPKMRLQLTNEHEEKKDGSNGRATDMANVVGNQASVQKNLPTPSRRENGGGIGISIPQDPGFTSPMMNASPSPSATLRTSIPAAAKPVESPKPSGTNNEESGSAKGGLSYDFYQQVVGTPDKTGESPSSSSSTVTSFMPKLTKGMGYEISPTLDVLATMSEADLAAVVNFAVSREGFGSIAWEGAVDVRNVDLDSVVTIEARDVAVYDTEEEMSTKPPVGSKLNRPAIITMVGIFPKDGGENATDEARKKMEKKIDKTTKKMGAELLSYDASTGVWKFRVVHFSRYGLSDDDSDEEVVEDEENEINNSQNINAVPDFSVGERAGRSRKMEGVGRTRIRLDSGDDEDMSGTEAEDSSAALTSDGEVTGEGYESTIQAADEAYNMLSSQNLESRAIDDMEVMDEESRFEDEGERVSDFHLPKALDPYAYVSTFGEGITSKLARKCGIRSATSSSTDFGLRMGKTFRVGWRPDGSFLVPSKVESGKFRIEQRRPVTGEVEHSLPLLGVHLKNSVNVDDFSGDRCPMYALPSALESNSYQALCSTLDDYTEAAKGGANDAGLHPELTMVQLRAFSLLSTLYGQEDSAPEEPVSNERRFEGVKIWLRDATSHDMVEAIKLSQSRGDPLHAIFHCLGGGNITKASSMAIDQGNLRLATLLASSDSQSRHDMEQQMQLLEAWPSIPPPLRRICGLLSGDHGVEEDLYKSSGSDFAESLDWRRRLSLLFLFSKDNSSLPSVLREYNANIAQGFVPPPFPRHIGNKPNHQAEDCVLYQMLQVWAEQSITGNNMSQTPASALLNPKTHTGSEHDYSTSFHLASTLSAIGCCMPLSRREEGLIVDSYVMQLISFGAWEWAVYVCICLSRGSHSNNCLQDLWKTRAMEIVERFYPRVGLSSSVSTRRAFLEERVGIPSSWFAYAAADKALSVGDASTYFANINEISTENPGRFFEDYILPNQLFGAKYDSKLEQYLGLVRDESVMHGLLRLLNGMSEVSKEDQSTVSAVRIEELEGLAIEVQQQLEDDAPLCEANRMYWPSRNMNDSRRIPLSVIFSEALSWVACMRLQLTALRGGFSIFDHGGIGSGSEKKRLKYASQLTHLTSALGVGNNFNHAQPFLGAGNFLRGSYGIA